MQQQSILHKYIQHLKPKQQQQLCIYNLFQKIDNPNKLKILYSQLLQNYSKQSESFRYIFQTHYLKPLIHHYIEHGKQHEWFVKILLQAKEVAKGQIMYIVENGTTSLIQPILDIYQNIDAQIVQKLYQKHFITKFNLKKVDNLKKISTIARLLNKFKYHFQQKDQMVDQIRKELQTSYLISKQLTIALLQLQYQFLLIDLSKQQIFQYYKKQRNQFLRILRFKNLVDQQKVLDQVLDLLKSTIDNQIIHQCLSIITISRCAHKIKDQQIFLQQVISCQHPKHIFLETECIKKIISTRQHPENCANKLAKKALQMNISKKKYAVLLALFQWLQVNTIKQMIDQLFMSSRYQQLSLVAIILQQCLKLLHKQYGYKEWIGLWQKKYFKLMNQNCMVTLINPILIKIDVRVSLYLIKQISEMQEMSQENVVVLGYLIKESRRNGFITAVNQNRQQTQNIHQYSGYLISQISYFLSQKKIQSLLLHANRHVALYFLELIIISQKPSKQLYPFQFDLILLFVKWQLNSSYQDFRKQYLILFRKLFNRLRTTYQRVILQKKIGKKKSFAYFDEWLERLIIQCFELLVPDSGFQRLSGSLQILKQIFNHFGPNQTEIKKGVFLKGLPILKKDSIMNKRNQYVMLEMICSTYQSIRENSLSVLMHMQISEQDYKRFYQKGLQMSESARIRTFQGGAYVLSWLYSKTQNKIQFLHNIMAIINQRFIRFYEKFPFQQHEKPKNTFSHGLLTTLALLIRQITQNYPCYKIHQIRQFVNQMFVKLNEILDFGVKISADNVSTSFFDNSSVRKNFQIDCRGHFIKQNKEQVIYGNCLLSSLDNQNQEQLSQNLLVCSFYLLTKQAGHVFQQLARLFHVSDKNNLALFEKQPLKKTIDTYFNALLSIKHNGSIDKIAVGLYGMVKSMNQSKNPILPKLGQELLNKLVCAIENGEFPNTLRKSAGIPYAFACLVSSSKYCIQFRRIISRIFMLAKSENNINKIHGLNILRKLYLEGDIRQLMQPLISTGYLIAFQCYTCQDYSVRNSAIMLFSVLTKRIQSKKISTRQFFHSNPQLIEFFQTQLSLQKAEMSVYPLIYPITVVFGVLLCQDYKNCRVIKKYQKFMKGQWIVCQKQINIQVLLTNLKGLLRMRNYMGRIMLSKAIIPLVQKNNLIAFAISLLQNLDFKSHNQMHSVLQCCNQLFRKYISCGQRNEQEQNKLVKEVLCRREQLLCNNKCRIVGYSYIRLIKRIRKEYKYNMQQNGDINRFICKYLQQMVFKCKYFIIYNDMGQSLIRKVILKYYIYFYGLHYTLMLLHTYQTQKHYFTCADHQLLEISLVKIYDKIKNKSAQILETEQLQLINCLYGVLVTKQAWAISFSRVILIIYKFVYRFYKIIKKNPKQLYQSLTTLNTTHIKGQLKLKSIIVTQCQDLEEDYNQQIYKRSFPSEQMQIRKTISKLIKKIDHYKLEIAIHNLLNDQVPWIRQNAATICSSQYNIPLISSHLIIVHILPKFCTKSLFQILKIGSSKIREKNFKQQRIFSYDKVNNFRCDFTNWRDVYRQLRNRQQVCQFVVDEQLVNNYDCNPLQRDEVKRYNQYMFEKIVLGIEGSKLKNGSVFLTNFFDHQELLFQ